MVLMLLCDWLTTGVLVDRAKDMGAVAVLQAGLKVATNDVGGNNGSDSAAVMTIGELIARHNRGRTNGGENRPPLGGNECDPGGGGTDIFLKGMDLPGGDLDEGMVHAENAVECCQHCQTYGEDDYDAASCHSWTYTPDGTCWLKGPMDDAVRPNMKEGMTSGE